MAELRELQLPPVPDEELPDMVRFQAIRSFASAGDSATVDFLVTERKDSGVELIAAAIGPPKLNEIRKTCEACGITARRVSLRPLAASTLYLTRPKASDEGTIVLIDLLAGDAEIVVAKQGRVTFVRTVRMPTESAARPRALAGELKRSLAACGVSGAPEKIVLWGRDSVHIEDRSMLAEAAKCPVDVLNPFELVDLEPKLRDELPEHVGRLAPLVGLLHADETHADRLIDFLNPRKRIEEEPNRLRTAAMVGVPALLAIIGGYMLYRNLGNMDAEITELKTANAAMKPAVDAAAASITRTETVDQFLDGDVNWLDEIRRLAVAVPPADKLIVRSLTGTTDPRRGGGKLVVAAGVTQTTVIDEFEQSVRDATHSVIGDGVNEAKNKDAYRYGINETITIESEAVRNVRYEKILDALMTEGAEDAEGAANSTAAASDSTPTTQAETEPETQTEPTPAGEPETNSESATTGEAVIEAEPATVGEPEPVVEPANETETRSVPEPQPDPQVETQTQSVTEELKVSA